MVIAVREVYYIQYGMRRLVWVSALSKILVKFWHHWMQTGLKGVAFAWTVALAY